MSEQFTAARSVVGPDESRCIAVDAKPALNVMDNCEVVLERSAEVGKYDTDVQHDTLILFPP